MLSVRGTNNLEAGADFDNLVKLLTNTYHKTNNPDGIVSLGVAENGLMHQELCEYFSKVKIEPQHLTYWDGPFGSRKLREGLAAHFNNRLYALKKVLPNEIVVVGGVTSAIDVVAFALADEHNGFLIGRPMYANFENDLMARSRVKLLPVNSRGVDPMGLDMVNEYEIELFKQEAEGTKVKGLILCNPHNPLGKCYSKEVLISYMRLCQKHQIHLVSDEVYAMSVFENPSSPTAPAFVSVLSIDPTEVISPSLIHILYGMSKDFACNGFRCGVLVSQYNPNFLVCAKSIACFSWPSSISDHLLSTLITDSVFLDYYFVENQKRLAKNYNIVTTFLTAYSIDFDCGGNSGFFIWADFRKLLLRNNQTRDKLAVANGQSSGGLQSEVSPRWGSLPPTPTASELASRCVTLQQTLASERVFIGIGSAFHAEFSGFYRITFSLPEEILALGLNRLGLVIKHMQASL